MTSFLPYLSQATSGKMKAHLSPLYNGRDTLSYTHRPLDQLHSSLLASPCTSWRPCSTAICTCCSWPLSRRKTMELAKMKKATKEVTMLLTPTGEWSTVILPPVAIALWVASVFILSSGTMVLSSPLLWSPIEPLRWQWEQHTPAHGYMVQL